MTQPGAYHKRLPRARQKSAQQARRRRLQREHERLQQEQVRAQRTLRALEQAVQALSLLETVAEDLHGHCRQLPAPVVADSWFGDSGLMAHVAS